MMNKLSKYQVSLIDRKIKIADNKLVVLLDVSNDKNLPKKESNLNIYCINGNYEIIWQIDTPYDDSKFDYDMFLYLEINKKVKLQADRFSGFKYIIDADSGKAKRFGWHK